MPKTQAQQAGKAKSSAAGAGARTGAGGSAAKKKTPVAKTAAPAAGGKGKPKSSPKNKKSTTTTTGSGKKKSTASPKNKRTTGSKSKTQAKGKGKGGKTGTPRKTTARRGAAASSSKKKKGASTPKGSKKKKTTGTSPKAGSKTALRSQQLKRRIKQAKKPKLTRRKQTEERKRAKIRNGILRREYLAARRAKAHSKFQIRCKKPVEDEIFDVDEFVKFLTERFKVNNKTGVVGSGKDATIQKSGTTIHVMSKQPFPKYYIKFLTKRYLKRNGLRDYVRVIADKKGSYELRYFNIQEEKDKSKKQEQ